MSHSSLVIDGRTAHYICKPGVTNLLPLQRLSCAAAETEYGEAAGNFDIVIVNDSLDEAYRRLGDFVAREY